MSASTRSNAAKTISARRNFVFQLSVACLCMLSSPWLHASDATSKVLDVQWQTDRESSQPLNVIFILTDDQRFDEMGFMNPVIDTPNIDRLAREGVHFKNAFVTTALCSPSRATILTGQYMHNHGVVDNNAPPNPNSVFFPQYLQVAGYGTWVKPRLRREVSMIRSLASTTGSASRGRDIIIRRDCATGL